MQIIDIDNIKKNLKYGDNKRINEATGLSLSYISEVLNGKKNSDLVLEAASKIAAENIERKKRIAEILPVIDSNSVTLR